jgi:hypothetical protein
VRGGRLLLYNNLCGWAPVSVGRASDVCISELLGEQVQAELRDSPIREMIIVRHTR